MSGKLFQSLAGIIILAIVGYVIYLNSDYSFRFAFILLFAVYVGLTILRRQYKYEPKEKDFVILGKPDFKQEYQALFLGGFIALLGLLPTDKQIIFWALGCGIILMTLLEIFFLNRYGSNRLVFTDKDVLVLKTYTKKFPYSFIRRISLDNHKVELSRSLNSIRFDLTELDPVHFIELQEHLEELSRDYNIRFILKM